MARSEPQRPWSRVPLAAVGILAGALTLHVLLHRAHPFVSPAAADLGPPPSAGLVQAASLGDPLAAAKLLNLVLQAHDNQPGLSVPFASLDYAMVTRWLGRILDLDPAGAYPLLAASRLYGEIPDAARVRVMLEFVHDRFTENPSVRWPYLAHAAHVARHRLSDPLLARRYAATLRRHAAGTTMPAWVRQMEVLLLADMDEAAAARVLLGALLDSGQVNDPAEYRFLLSRIDGSFGRSTTAPGEAK
ncbi:MAG: hypothetical protein JNM90_02885 [Burkholderiales bacterium]|nr:hypothetical protein [Burkholderiales bacterium]